MTKEQYIDYWIDTANNDWLTVEAIPAIYEIP